MAKVKEHWICKECGNESPVFNGKCFACGNFNTFEKQEYFTGKDSDQKSAKTINQNVKKSQKLKDVEEGVVENGFSSKIDEFDRVCGGQITEGSVILLGGDPGNGKSTILSTVSDNLSQEDQVLYVSGEESEYQLKNRLTKRMEIKPNDNFNVLYTNDIQNVEDESLDIKPKLMVVDSINTIGSKDIKGDPGDPSQMKHCIARIISLAKNNDITIICVAQITKDNDFAGPKKLEHMVDTVLYLEGDKQNDLRMIRVTKNRFGSDDVVSCFKMTSKGMEEIKNPSEYLLRNRPKNESGTSVVCITESRPLLVEVQALVSLPAYENAVPRRTSEGFSRNRLNLLIAVLEKKCNLNYLSAKDVYINVVNGLDLKDPGTDLGVALALYSSEKKTPIPDDTVTIGEVGLTGEIRPIPQIEQLVKESERVGFKTCIIPESSYESVKDVTDHIELLPVKNLNDCLNKLFT